MGRSRGFGSIACDSFALFGLGFPATPELLLLNLAANNNSRTHYAKGTPSHLAVLRLLVSARFQVLFHSPRRGSFHLSLTVLVHYRSSEHI